MTAVMMFMLMKVEDVEKKKEKELATAKLVDVENVDINKMGVQSIRKERAFINQMSRHDMLLQIFYRTKTTCKLVGSFEAYQKGVKKVTIKTILKVLSKSFSWRTSSGRGCCGSHIQQFSGWTIFLLT